MYQSYLDMSTPYLTYRWIGTAVLFFFFFLRILLAQGWYIGISPSPPPFPLPPPKAKTNPPTPVAYSLGIYLLNLFLAFISPKFDPSLEADEGMEDGVSGLPSRENEEFRPFVRRLPEFKFWYSATRAIAIGFVCCFFTVFDLPVLWPVLVVYWIILAALTSKFSHWGCIGMAELMRNSEAADTAYDQVSLRTLHRGQDTVCAEIDNSLR